MGRHLWKTWLARCTAGLRRIPKICYILVPGNWLHKSCGLHKVSSRRLYHVVSAQNVDVESSCILELAQAIMSSTPGEAVCENKISMITHKSTSCMCNHYKYIDLYIGSSTTRKARSFDRSCVIGFSPHFRPKCN